MCGEEVSGRSISRSAYLIEFYQQEDLMSLRLVELFLPETSGRSVQSLLDEKQVLGIWQEKIDGGQAIVRILLRAEDIEAVLDVFDKKFSTVEGFRVLLLPVEATVPRPQEPEESKEGGEEAVEEAKPKPERISREELYNDIADSAKISRVYVVMVVLSSIVAAIGLMHNNITVVIGAMVIAPLLGPNVALSLATTLGDTDLARRAMKVNAVGIFVGLSLSVAIGRLFHVSPDIPEILARTKVGLIDVVLALASGSAGALAFTTGVPAALIGVMVAVALLPPLVVLGMLLGAGFAGKAVGALLLLLTNLICVNLSGVITFLVQGIRPVTWWEADRAKRATRISLIMWLLLLSALVGLILLARGR
jgi:uncharacterized hydrophobic protein (TIGR00341 family)